MIYKKYQFLRKVGNSTKLILYFWVDERGIVNGKDLTADKLRAVLQLSLQNTVYSVPTGEERIIKDEK